MLGPNLVLVERMADHAVLIDLFSLRRISRREARRRLPGREHGGQRRHDGGLIASTRARGQPRIATKFHLHHLPRAISWAGSLLDRNAPCFPFTRSHDRGRAGFIPEAEAYAALSAARPWNRTPRSLIMLRIQVRAPAQDAGAPSLPWQHGWARLASCLPVHPVEASSQHSAADGCSSRPQWLHL